MEGVLIWLLVAGIVLLVSLGGSSDHNSGPGGPDNY